MITDFFGFFILLIVRAVTPENEQEYLARKMKRKR
jgi:hypothetical protein